VLVVAIFSQFLYMIERKIPRTNSKGAVRLSVHTVCTGLVNTVVVWLLAWNVTVLTVKGKKVSVPQVTPRMCIRDSGAMAPLNLKLGIRWRWFVDFTPGRPLLLIEKRQGGPQSRFWSLGEDRNPLLLPGFERRFRSLVTARVCCNCCGCHSHLYTVPPPP
jgi:hypothetical protein